MHTTLKIYFPSLIKIIEYLINKNILLFLLFFLIGCSSSVWKRADAINETIELREMRADLALKGATLRQVIEDKTIYQFSRIDAYIKELDQLLNKIDTLPQKELLKEKEKVEKLKKQLYEYKNGMQKDIDKYRGTEPEN
jgi:hypothetical protein